MAPHQDDMSVPFLDLDFAWEVGTFDLIQGFDLSYVETEISGLGAIDIPQDPVIPRVVMVASGSKFPAYRDFELPFLALATSGFLASNIPLNPLILHAAAVTSACTDPVSYDSDLPPAYPAPEPAIGPS